jgi:hypothetical protein
LKGSMRCPSSPIFSPPLCAPMLHLVINWNRLTYRN